MKGTRARRQEVIDSGKFWEFTLFPREHESQNKPENQWLWGLNATRVAIYIWNTKSESVWRIRMGGATGN